MKVTLASYGLVPPKQAAYLDGANLGAGPESFRWQWVEPSQARFVTEECLSRAPGPGQIAWLLEPFFLHPENYLQDKLSAFDYVLSHDRQFVMNQEKWLYYPAGGSWIEFDKWGLREKRHNISMLLSNKRMTRGHRLRHEIRAKYGSRLDAVLGLDRRATPFEALADYRYSIIVENEKSRGWFTEKLIDCLSVGTVPIYWGDPDISGVFNPRGLCEFDDLGELNGYLELLLTPGAAEYEYAQRRGAIAENLERAKEYRICEDWIYKAYPFLFTGSNDEP